MEEIRERCKSFNVDVRTFCDNLPGIQVMTDTFGMVAKVLCRTDAPTKRIQMPHMSGYSCLFLPFVLQHHSRMSLTRTCCLDQ